MNPMPKKPKRRIPLPKKTEKVIRDQTLYTRKKKHKVKPENNNQLNNRNAADAAAIIIKTIKFR